MLFGSVVDCVHSGVSNHCLPGKVSFISIAKKKKQKVKNTTGQDEKQAHWET